MKIKKCTGEGCNYEGSLWQSQPPRCKTCSMKEKARKITYKPITSDSFDGFKANAIHMDEMAMMGSPKEKKGKLIYSTSQGIKPVSDKQAKRLAEYRIVRDKYMADHPFCEICGKIANDLHHKRGRGEHLCSVEYFMAVCRPCHTRIEDDSAYAYGNGYKIPRLEE